MSSKPKRRQHYVPKFYLAGFGSLDKRINLYNLSRKMAVQDASLRDQCYLHRFYGKGESIEERLGSLESFSAPVLHAVIRRLTVPPVGSDERLGIYVFLVLQLLRTPAAAERINASVDKTMKRVFSRDPRFSDTLDSVQIGYDDPVLVSLSHLGDGLLSVSDLDIHLVVAPEGRHFVTSDNPAFKYNQYCEGIGGIGVTGTLCRGLQVFLPLSPCSCLIFYDHAVYRAGTVRKPTLSTATDDDVNTLNMLQVITAHENLYFSDWQQLDEVCNLVDRSAGRRDSDPMQVREFAEEGNPNNVLLQTYDRMPNLKLRLSFLRMTKEARHDPPLARVQRWRKKLPLDDVPEPPALRGCTVRFVDSEHKA